MIDAAKTAGADVIKTQKRDPSMMCIPEAQRVVLKETPWGTMDYASYRRRLEFGRAEYDQIDAYCRSLGVPWTASVWDPPSVGFLAGYDVPFLKVPSAGVTDRETLEACAATGRQVVLSTGMSTLAEIDAAVARLDRDRLMLLHTHSTYPCAVPDLNLQTIGTLKARYGVPVGYSNHATGLWMSLCAVAMGAVAVEVHFTLDRAAFGTDQASSIEPRGLAQLVRQIRNFEQARGDGRIGPTESEAPVRAKLRRIP